MTIQPVAGGITAARGFRAAGVSAGIKASGALDIALIVPDAPAAAAALFTTNQVQAAPVTVSREHLARSGGCVAAVLVNSGCANACTGADGLRVARESSRALAARMGCSPDHVLIASTGVIGVALSLEKVRSGIERAHSALAADGHAAALAIMTTDAGPKEYAVRVETAEWRLSRRRHRQGRRHDRAADGDDARLRHDRCRRDAGGAAAPARVGRRSHVQRHHGRRRMLHQRHRRARWRAERAASQSRAPRPRRPSWQVSRRCAASSR